MEEARLKFLLDAVASLPTEEDDKENERGQASLSTQLKKLSLDGNGREFDLDYLLDSPIMGDEKALNMIADAFSNCPSNDLADLLLEKAEVDFRNGAYEKVALALLHCKSFAIQHQALHKHANKTSPFEDEAEKRINEINNDCLSFKSSHKGPQVVKDILKELPSRWRIVQMNAGLITRSTFTNESLIMENNNRVNENEEIMVRGTKKRLKSNPDLYVTIAEKVPEDGDEVTATTFLAEAIGTGEERSSLANELKVIIEANRSIYIVKSEYTSANVKANKEDVEQRISILINSLERKWLKFISLLFRKSKSPNPKITLEVENLIKKFGSKNMSKEQLKRDKLILRAVVENIRELSINGEDREIFLSALDQLSFPEKNMKSLEKALLELKNRSKDILPMSSEADFSPIVLILDNEVQSFPWESMKSLKNVPVSRMPNLHLLIASYKSHRKDQQKLSSSGVDPGNIFYVLNPNNDLPKTEKRLVDVFKEEFKFGEGFVRSWPTAEYIQKAFKSKDAFVYCGHGVTLKPVRLTEIEKMTMNALPLLFGCNSGKLERLGRFFDVTGAAHSYLIATAPCILGFLWSITDLDLDLWTETLLTHWLGGGGGEDKTGRKEFVRSVAEKRHEFKRVINSSALVVYGLPEH